MEELFTTTLSTDLETSLSTFESTSLRVTSNWVTDTVAGKIEIDDYTIATTNGFLGLKVDFTDGYYDVVASSNGTQIFSVDNTASGATFNSSYWNVSQPFSMNLTSGNSTLFCLLYTSDAADES